MEPTEPLTPAITDQFVAALVEGRLDPGCRPSAEEEVNLYEASKIVPRSPFGAVHHQAVPASGALITTVNDEEVAFLRHEVKQLRSKLEEMNHPPSPAEYPVAVPRNSVPGTSDLTQQRPRKHWLARGPTMLHELQSQQESLEPELLRSISFRSQAGRSSKGVRITSPTSRTDGSNEESKGGAAVAPNGEQRPLLSAISAPSSGGSSLLEGTIRAMVKLDAVQSEQLSRSLRMRAECHVHVSQNGPATRKGLALSSIRVPTMTDTITRISNSHAAGYGQTRQTVRGPMDTIDTSLVKSFFTSTVGQKDARILPSLRRDFARAVGLVSDNDSGIVIADAYLTRLINALRLFQEIRESLHGVVAACLACAADGIAGSSQLAASSPAEMLPASVVASPASNMSPKDLVVELLVAMQTAAWKRVVAAVHKETGDAVRLLVRCRAFIAQVQSRVNQLQDLTSADGASLAEGKQRRTMADAMRRISVSSGVEDNHSILHGLSRRTSVNSVAMTAHTSTRGDENPVAAAARRLADEDFQLIQGSLGRVLESKIKMHAEEPEDHDFGDTMISLAAIGGIRSTAKLVEHRTALAATSPLLLSAAAPTFEASGRDPPYDPAHPEPFPGSTFEVDAIEFARYQNAYGGLLATGIASAPAVAEEDGFISAHQLAHEMMSTMVLEHNIDIGIASGAIKPLLWVVWRHALIRYAQSVRERYTAGVRDMWTSVLTARPKPPAPGPVEVCPSKKPAPRHRLATASPVVTEALDPPEDITAGSSSRLAVDVHLCLSIFRLVEATALVHLFPIS